MPSPLHTRFKMSVTNSQARNRHELKHGYSRCRLKRRAGLSQTFRDLVSHREGYHSIHSLPQQRGKKEPTLPIQSKSAQLPSPLSAHSGFPQEQQWKSLTPSSVRQRSPGQSLAASRANMVTKDPLDKSTIKISTRRQHYPGEILVI